MFLGGLQRHSLIDFPGRVSCVCFLAGCNFRCPYCHNPDLVAPGASYPRILDNDFFAFLETRKGLLDGVVLSGGEPTLEEHLPAFCERIRSMGFGVKLDTNGSRPSVIRSLVQQGLLDYIAMDLKTGIDRYPALMNGPFRWEAIEQSVRLIMDSGLDYEFRTTCVNPFVDEPMVRQTAALIEGARRYVLQPFRRARLLDPGFFRGREPGYTEEEMDSLRALAAPFVQECFLRG
jgi:pyruvate formate lyase activating enzyme